MNILVIDDDPDTRANLHDILEEDGHRVESFGTLAEVFQRGDLSEFAVVLLDRRLPDGWAEQHLPHLKACVPGAAVIVITGYADLDAVIVALRNGAADFIVKPLHPERLKARLEHLVKLREAEQRAAQAERLAAIGQMQVALSHESRNVLSQLQLSLAMLEELAQGLPAARAPVAIAQKAVKRLRGLFEDLRGYAAPIVLHRERHPLDQIVWDAWNSLLPLHQDRRVRLNADGDSVSCAVDRARLEQVFRNILENSLAACADPVEIAWRLTAAQAADHRLVRIALRDNGPGLTAEQQRKVFDPFYTTKPNGTGLGMAICKRIVEAHGGDIAVESIPGQGAQFVVTLPDVHLPQEAATGRPHLGGQHHLRTVENASGFLNSAP
jgi:signal transduction histidine kinase